MQNRLSSRVFLDSAIASSAAGIFLLLVSWWMTYPLYLHSVSSEIFFAVHPTYWVALGLAVPSLFFLARSSPNRIYRAVACVLIFLVIVCSFSQFFNIPYASDPYFWSLSQYYISNGHVSSFQTVYWQPSFFILANLFQLVTGLTIVTYQHLFLLFVGVLTALAVFLIADRKGVDSGGAMLAFSVLVFYFIDYQFAAQALVLPLVLLMIAIDVRPSRSRWFVQVVIFASACLVHAFFAVMYLLYVAFSGGLSKERKVRRVLLLGGIFGGIQLFVLTIFFRKVVQMSYESLEEAMGLTYRSVYAQSAPISLDPLVQLVSRATVIGMGLVSVFGLYAMIRRREFSSRDLALSLAGAVYMIMGLPLNLLGERALQLLGVIGGLGGGYFGAMKGKWQPMILVILAVGSVSLQMHISYNAYLFQDPISVRQVIFVSSHLDQNQTSVYMENVMRPILEYDMRSRGLNVITVTEFTNVTQWGYSLDTLDYYAMTPGLFHNDAMGLSQNPLPILRVGTNRIIDDGRNWWIAGTG